MNQIIPKLMKNKISIYTDGATRANGTSKARGGWGWCIVNEYDTIIQKGNGGKKNTTNNRMELTAVLEGLRAAYELDDIDNCYIDLYSDSAYFINCYTQKWYEKWLQNGWVNSSRQPVANRDLWEQIIPYFNKTEISFYKVKGHAGNTYNEYVDKLACQGADVLI